MDQDGIINLTQRALKIINESDEDKKEEGLSSLEQILSQKDVQLVALGYDQVISKELIKLTQFEGGKHLEKVLKILKEFYFDDKKHQDELMETLVYRVARSTDGEICRLCLESISSLVDCFDEAIAKHSKQLLRLADLNDIASLNPIISEILQKMRPKLPERRTVSN